MSKKVLRRISSTAMGALMFVCLPLTSFARTIDVGSLTAPEMVNLADETDGIIITGTSNSSMSLVYIISANDKNKIVTLQDLHMNAEGDMNGIGFGGSGDVVVELDGENSLSADQGPGLYAPSGIVLTIKDDNGTAGSLEATGATMCPGIGSGSGEEGSNIIIEGGTIIATGGAGGAGIGGGHHTPATVTINGGTVTAIGGNDAAGIGSGGDDGDDSNGTGAGIVTINGGTVIAIGGRSGAGIGGGVRSGGSSITVSNDANVYAVGGVSGDTFGDGAAIGEGGNAVFDLINGDNIDPDTSGLYKTGSITTFAVGTTLEQIKNNEVTGTTVYGTLEDPNAPTQSTETTTVTTDPADPEESAPAKPSKPETVKQKTPEGAPAKPETPKKTVYTERSYIADVNVAAYVEAALKANAKEVTIDFSDNICLTPDIMKDLFADGRVVKNCLFSHHGKRYVLRIGAVDTSSAAYAAGFEALKKEPDGLAGFLRMAQIFKDLGVTANQIEK